MLRIHALPFIEASGSLTELASKIAPLKDTDAFAPGLMRTIYLKQVEALIEQLEAMELSMTLVPAKNLRLLLGTENTMAGLYRGTLRETQSRLRDEIGGRFLFSLSASDAIRFEADFGPGIATKFPGLTYEIEEGNKCLALGRSTAAAFHFVRCLEGGISALSKCLSVPDPTKGADRNWSILLRKLDDAASAKWPSAASRFGGDGEFFEWATGTLKAMQNPYRNATMHLDQKYTPDEAKQIMDLVRPFLQKITSRMDEQGDPKA